MPSREWLEETTTISREEAGRIVTEAIARVMIAAEKAKGNKDLNEQIQELLMVFSADILSEMFPENEDLEVI